MNNHLWNMFANIINGQFAKVSCVTQTRKNICESFLNILWDEGYILGYKISKIDSTKLKIYLKYYKNEPVIHKFKPISKPSKRIYYSLKNLWKIDSSKTYLIISTNRGLKSIINCKKQKLGGEALAVIN